MSGPLLLLVSVIYWGVAIDQWIKGSPAGFVVWASYGMANWEMGAGVLFLRIRRTKVSLVLDNAPQRPKIRAASPRNEWQCVIRRRA